MTLDPSAVGALNALSWRGWVVHRGMARSGVRRGEIDYVLVGPGGVFVVSRLRDPGPVEVVPGQLLVKGKPRVEEADEVAADAADVLGVVPDVPVHAVLCLEQHEPVNGWVRNVMVCATSTVEELVTTRPPVLSPERVQEVGFILAAHLRRRPLEPPGARSNGNGSTRTTTERALLLVAALAVAVVVVAGMFQSGVVAQIPSAMNELVEEPVEVDRTPPAPEPTDAEPSPELPDPSQQVEEGHEIEVKGAQCTVRDRKKDRPRCDEDEPRRRQDREQRDGAGRPRG